MEEQVARLAKKAWKLYQGCDASKRLLIAISGIPGSGKTTLAASVVAGINALYHADLHAQHPNFPSSPDPSQPDVAYVVPLDGYHLTRKQLSEMPNAEEAVFRRGAAFTFDPYSYFNLVEKLQKPLEATTPTIFAPSFDHAVKDPVANDIGIPPTARIIIFEGLYVAMDRDGWRDAAELMDEIWAIEVSMAVAEARVAKRNFAAGLSPTLEDALARTRANDMRNGRDVLAERLPVQEIVHSEQDESWKSEDMSRVEREQEQAQRQGQEGDDPQPGRVERMDSIAALTADGAGW